MPSSSLSSLQKIFNKFFNKRQKSLELCEHGEERCSKCSLYNRRVQNELRALVERREENLTELYVKPGTLSKAKQQIKCGHKEIYHDVELDSVVFRVRLLAVHDEYPCPYIKLRESTTRFHRATETSSEKYSLRILSDTLNKTIKGKKIRSRDSEHGDDDGGQWLSASKRIRSELSRRSRPDSTNEKVLEDSEHGDDEIDWLFPGRHAEENLSDSSEKSFPEVKSYPGNSEHGEEELDWLFSPKILKPDKKSEEENITSRDSRHYNEETVLQFSPKMIKPNEGGTLQDMFRYCTRKAPCQREFVMRTEMNEVVTDEIVIAENLEHAKEKFALIAKKMRREYKEKRFRELFNNRKIKYRAFKILMKKCQANNLEAQRIRGFQLPEYFYRRKHKNPDNFNYEKVYPPKIMIPVTVDGLVIDEGIRIIKCK